MKCANCGHDLNDANHHTETKTEKCLKELSEKVNAVKTTLNVIFELEDIEDA